MLREFDRDSFVYQSRLDAYAILTFLHINSFLDLLEEEHGKKQIEKVIEEFRDDQIGIFDVMYLFYVVSILLFKQDTSCQQTRRVWLPLGCFDCSICRYYKR